MYGQHAKIRILIVDDAAQVRQDLRSLLAMMEDLEVAGEAADGAGAVRQAALLRPDAIIMDLEMPVVDGFAAAARIRPLLTQCRIVALTAHDNDAARAKAREAGFDALVVKGAPLSELLGAIGSFAAQSIPPTGGSL